LHIGGRAADDVEDVAGRSLVFERFFEIARARLQLAEQPRILDRDDRLVSEGANQFDLPLRERLDSCPSKRDHADRLAVAQQWHPKSGASPGPRGLANRMVRVGGEVLDMHDPTFERHPSGEGFATGEKSSLAHGPPILRLRRTE